MLSRRSGTANLAETPGLPTGDTTGQSYGRASYSPRERNVASLGQVTILSGSHSLSRIASYFRNGPPSSDCDRVSSLKLGRHHKAHQGVRTSLGTYRVEQLDRLLKHSTYYVHQ
jgi:hypothetical protein